MSSMGKTALPKEIIESAVRVNPKSLKTEAALKTPHHGRPWPASVTTEPYVALLKIHGVRIMTPRIWKDRKYAIRTIASVLRARYSIPPNSSRCSSLRLTKAEFLTMVGTQLKYGASSLGSSSSFDRRKLVFAWMRSLRLVPRLDLTLENRLAEGSADDETDPAFSESTFGNGVALSRDRETFGSLMVIWFAVCGLLPKFMESK
jgi:hypothetical protein